MSATDHAGGRIERARRRLRRAARARRKNGRRYDSGLRAASWRRFLACRSGASALEFALIAVPFFGVVFLIVNTALVFFAQQALQTATTNAARLIMTGQAQAQGLTASQFKQAICNDAGALFSCSGISVNVQTYSSFTSVSLLNPVQNGVFSNANMGFSLGKSGDIEVVQVFYEWPIYGSLMGLSLANVSGTMNLIIATAAFRNEPFNGG